MIIEKFKEFHGSLFSVIEGLFGMVVALESQLKAHTEDDEDLMPLRGVEVYNHLHFSEANRIKMISQTEPDDSLDSVPVITK